MSVEYSIGLYRRFADWVETSQADLEPDTPVLVVEAVFYPGGSKGKAREAVGHTRYFVPPKSEEN